MVTSRRSETETETEREREVQDNTSKLYDKVTVSKAYKCSHVQIPLSIVVLMISERSMSAVQGMPYNYAMCLWLVT